MIRRKIVVTLWTGTVTVRRLGPDDPEPTQADLDAIATAWTAHNDGVRPTARVLETQVAGTQDAGGVLAGPAGTVPR